MLLSIPFALTYTFGKMVGSVRHGVALLAAMVLLFGVWVGFTANAEHQNNPAVAAAHVYSPVGNMEGKEVRFGDTTTALFGVSLDHDLRRGRPTVRTTRSRRWADSDS